MVIRTVLVIYMGQNIQVQEMTCIMILKVVGLVLTTVGPAIIILMLSYLIPIIATFYICLICCSSMLVNSITKLIRGDGKPAFPLYFVFINFIDKVILMIDLFGMKNAYDIEYDGKQIYYILGVMLF